ncbi:MAG: hypothetical protein QM802_05315 [Agriterribacter sp.]
MAFSRKKSRTVLIDNIKYCWLVGSNDGYNVFVAQKEVGTGRKIEVYFETDINSYWVEFLNVDKLNLKIIKPKDSETIIRQALQLGWNPEQKGSPLVYDLIDNRVVKRERI